MKKLLSGLRLAHAIEIGASKAYEGHYRSLPKGSSERLNVFLIMKDEIKHRETIYRVLCGFRACPNPILDLIFWCVGSSISIGCRFMGRRTAMWGAKLMERMGKVCYNELARLASGVDREHLSDKLIEMYLAEKRHEEFFRGVLEGKL